jgi:hypothetical protein
MTAKVIPLRRIARAMKDARAIGTPEDEWRRLRNEVALRRQRESARSEVSGRDGLFFIAGAATALYVIGVIALAGWAS